MSQHRYDRDDRDDRDDDHDEIYASEKEAEEAKSLLDASHSRDMVSSHGPSRSSFKIRHIRLAKASLASLAKVVPMVAGGKLNDESQKYKNYLGKSAFKLTKAFPSTYSPYNLGLMKVKRGAWDVPVDPDTGEPDQNDWNPPEVDRTSGMEDHPLHGKEFSSLKHAEFKMGKLGYTRDPHSKTFRNKEGDELDIFAHKNGAFYMVHEDGKGGPKMSSSALELWRRGFNRGRHQTPWEREKTPPPASGPASSATPPASSATPIAPSATPTASSGPTSTSGSGISRRGSRSRQRSQSSTLSRRKGLERARARKRTPRNVSTPVASTPVASEREGSRPPKSMLSLPPSSGKNQVASERILTTPPPKSMLALPPGSKKKPDLNFDPRYSYMEKMIKLAEKDTWGEEDPNFKLPEQEEEATNYKGSGRNLDYLDEFQTEAEDAADFEEGKKQTQKYINLIPSLPDHIGRDPKNRDEMRRAIASAERILTTPHAREHLEDAKRLIDNTYSDAWEMLASARLMEARDAFLNGANHEKKCIAEKKLRHDRTAAAPIRAHVFDSRGSERGRQKSIETRQDPIKRQALADMKQALADRSKSSRFPNMNSGDE